MPIISNFKKLFHNPNTTTSTSYTTVEAHNNNNNNNNNNRTLSNKPSTTTSIQSIDKSQAKLNNLIINNYSISSPELSLPTSNDSTSNNHMMNPTTNNSTDTTTTINTNTIINTNTNTNTTTFSLDTQSYDELYPDLPSNYKLQYVLGEGAFSTVFKANDTKTNTPIAIKVINKLNLSQKQYQNIINEISIMKKLNNHPNILKLIDSIQTNYHCFLVLEYCNGGEIFNKIIEYTYFSEVLSKHVFKQLLSALHHLHSMNIVHRDIKPENLLFKKIPYLTRKDGIAPMRKSDDDTKVDEGEFKLHIGGGTIGLIKLADFGLAKQLSRGKILNPLKTPCGTAGYTAPEVITCNNNNSNYKTTPDYYSKAVDIWSLGCLLYTMLCGFPPFYEEDGEDLTLKITQGRFVFLKPWWDEISDEAKDLISKMLNINPQDRITIEEIYNHPWMKKDFEQDQPATQSEYFNYHVDQVDVEASDLEIPQFTQPMSSPRAQAIKKVFDNPAMNNSTFDQTSSQFIEDIDEDEEQEEEGGEEVDEVTSQMPDFRNVFSKLHLNSKNYDDGTEDEDEDEKLSYDFDEAVTEYQTRSSSIISSTLNIEDSKLLIRRKSLKKQ